MPPEYYSFPYPLIPACKMQAHLRFLKLNIGMSFGDAYPVSLVFKQPVSRILLEVPKGPAQGTKGGQQSESGLITLFNHS